MKYLSRAAAAAAMIRDARIFYEYGWLLGTSGNLSIRASSDAFLITASGRDKGDLAPADFLLRLVDAGDLAAQPGFLPADLKLKPSAETSIHQAIYRRVPGAGAIYHVHELYSALCSQRDWERGATEIAGVEMLKGLGLWEPDTSARLPIFENHAHVPDIAAEIDTFLRDPAAHKIPAVNIRGHGFYAWGEGAFAAKRHVETLAYLFRYSWESKR